MRDKGDGGLTPEAFEALLALLGRGGQGGQGDQGSQEGQGNPGGGEKYLKLHAKLVRFFEWRGSGCPEDLADETINRVARRILEGVEIQAVDSYIGRVAQLVLKEVWRQPRLEETGEEPRPPVALPEEPQEDRRMECLLRCLDRLKPEDRQLILGYHPEADRIRGRRDLAAELGIRLNALRIRAHRLRRELQACIESCLAKSP